MNTSKYLMIVLIMLSSVACNAQFKNAKTETVKIYGNCGMCKNTIEKAGNMKKVASVDWNIDSKMATITYDSTKTNADEILKRIALAGYDNEKFLAPDEAYAGLHGCCKYERANKISETKSETHHHAQHTSMKETGTETSTLKVVFDSYFSLKDALVKTDSELAATEAKGLLTAINAVEMDKLSTDAHTVWMKTGKDLASDAEHISKTKEIEHQRERFITLSKNMYELIKVSGLEIPVYYQFCPMANNGTGAHWLSKESTIKNPYYGSQMLTCGKTIETIQ